MLTALWLVLLAATGSVDQPTIIRPGTPEEARYLVDDHSALREIGYDPQRPFTRVADGAMAYTYRFEPGRGHRAFVLVEVSSQFALSARAETDAEWTRVADMDRADRLGSYVLVDLTPFAQRADRVLLRFADKLPQDGWGALTSELRYFADDQPGPIRLDLPADGRFSAPASWRGQRLAVYLPDAEPAPPALTLGGRRLTVGRTYDGGWWADASAALRPGATNELALGGPARRVRVGLALPACAVPADLPPDRRWAPYRPEIMDALAGNYQQCLLDERYNLLAFRAAERQTIHFVHDTLRGLSALVEEARRTGIERPELARRLYLGCKQAILPGGEDLFAFKHDERPLDIRPLPDSADLTLVHKLDVARTVAAVGVTLDQPRVTDRPLAARDGGWRLERTWTAGDQAVRAVGDYWPGDADRAPRLTFSAERRQPYTLRIGRLAAAGMWFQPGSWGAEALVLPDGSTHWLRDGLPTIDPARTPYLLLRGGNTGEQTWCRALLVAFDGPVNAVRFATVPGGRHGALIDAVLLDADGSRPVTLHVFPFAGQTEACATARTIARRIIRDGQLGCGRLDPVETASACGLGVEGMAAAAWMLRRHHLPEAAEAEALALRVMRSTVALDQAGIHSAELYNQIDAPRLLAELGHREWLPWLDTWGERILAMQQPDGSYPWLDQQLRMMAALLKLHESTGQQRYRDAFDRALATVGYQGGRLIWKGQPREAGDFAGALTTGIYGRLGRLDSVRDVLAARAGYLDDRGFQACSDLNPYMIGLAGGRTRPTGPPLVLDLTHFAQPSADGPRAVDWPTCYAINPHHPWAAAIHSPLP